MRKIRSAIVTVLVLGLLLLAACGTGAGSSSQAGDAGSGTQQAADPLEGIDADSRVVALSRSIGELWLLAGGQLVGVTDDAFDLPGLPEDAESVGTLTKPDLAAIVNLSPDLVMLNDELPAHKELHASLDEAGIPVLVVDINSFDDYADEMAALTRLTGRDDLLEDNVDAVRAKIKRVMETGTRRDGDSYLALRISPTVSKALKSDNFACDIIDDFGLSNVADDTDAFDELALDEIATADPDWIFVVFQGDQTKALKAYEEAFASEAAWAELAAVKAGHVVMLPKALFQYKPNAKWGEAYSYLSQTLHGAWA